MRLTLQAGAQRVLEGLDVRPPGEICLEREAKLVHEGPVEVVTPQSLIVPRMGEPMK